ncbi:hypothetical protein BANRA_00081 [Escherichia coli]|nr:hypothetical protein BANRA_00081 [Escherichia coli]
MIKILCSKYFVPWFILGNIMHYNCVGQVFVLHHIVLTMLSYYCTSYQGNALVH